MTARLPAALVLFALVSGLAVPAEAAKKDRKKEPRKAQDQAAPAPAKGCKEPAPVNAQLAAGLASYVAGRWDEAAATLLAWSETPDADKDPAAARGFYALSYALRTARGPSAGLPALNRARPLLEARTKADPTLEAWYYLQGLHQMTSDQAAQLTAVSTAIRSVEAGEICATRDGDDWFRLARLYGFAGNEAKKSECMRAAGEAFSKLPADAPASPYRPLVEKELGDAALRSNDLPAAEEHLAMAAKLDPTIPGVHKQLGLVMLQRGKIQAAADHWRRTWKIERDGGNGFMYALPVMNKVLAYRALKDFEEPLTGLSQFSIPALEQNAITEGKQFLTLRADQENAIKENVPFPDEKVKQMKSAEYKCLQYLLEYVTRGSDLQEFALQNGLLPVIHGRDLPTR